jgi:hypothetical protein
MIVSSRASVLGRTPTGHPQRNLLVPHTLPSNRRQLKVRSNLWNN